MGKLSLNIKPIFMKVFIITPRDRVYTIGPFIYNPHIRFKHTATSFIYWITNLVSQYKLKYDITMPASIMFTLVYPMEAAKLITNYEVKYPIPRDFEVSESLREIQEKLAYKARLESKVDLIARDIEYSRREVGVFSAWEYKRNSIVDTMGGILSDSPIIDELIDEFKLGSAVKRGIAQSLVDARLEHTTPTLQNVLGIFIGKLGINTRDIDLCSQYIKVGILLIRWLASVNKVKLTRSGHFSPYTVEFADEEVVQWINSVFYINKVFYSRAEFSSKFSRVIPDLEPIEFTPITLNHDYFTIIREIYIGLRDGSLPRAKFGFYGLDQHK